MNKLQLNAHVGSEAYVNFHKFAINDYKQLLKGNIENIFMVIIFFV